MIQLALSSPTLPEQTVFDVAVNQLRPQLVTMPGVAIPFPYGGKIRLISVDLDPAALQARGLAPADVVNAVNAQNLILPSGTASSATPNTPCAERRARRDRRAERPAGAHGQRRRVYLRDVAQVRDGFPPQTNIVRQDGSAACCSRC